MIHLLNIFFAIIGAASIYFMGKFVFNTRLEFHYLVIIYLLDLIYLEIACFIDHIENNLKNEIDEMNED